VWNSGNHCFADGHANAANTYASSSNSYVGATYDDTRAADRHTGSAHDDSCPTFTYPLATHSNPCPTHAYVPATYQHAASANGHTIAHQCACAAYQYAHRGYAATNRNSSDQTRLFQPG
jgi:hypothetical protein